jgi:hypothetical protein
MSPFYHTDIVSTCISGVRPRSSRNVGLIQEAERGQQVHLGLVVVRNRACVWEARLTNGVLCLQYIEEKTGADLEIFPRDPSGSRHRNGNTKARNAADGGLIVELRFPVAIALVDDH